MKIERCIPFFCVIPLLVRVLVLGGIGDNLGRVGICFLSTYILFLPFFLSSFFTLDVYHLPRD